MDENLGSFKVLEQVRLKVTQNIEINGRSFEEGETIAYFDRIQVAGLNELKDYVAARGGFDNRAHVFWETTKEVRLTFSQGVFSSTQFGLLNNANVIRIEQDDPILITKQEILEVKQDGFIDTTEQPYDRIFCYLKETGQKIYGRLVENKLYVGALYAYQDMIVEYRYNYTGGATVAKIGQNYLRGFLELEGKTRVKDDTSGLITTGIIKIPKLKLMSGLSIKLGAQASPVVGNFNAVGVPVESRHESYVVEFDFLNNDIDSDM